MKTGNPLSTKHYRDPIENIAAHTEREGECLVWTGSRNQKGYGRIKIDKVLYSVHRVAWEIENGPIPEGMQIDHLCWNRSCINLKHLRLATRSENKRNARGARVDSELGIRNIRRDSNGYMVRIMKDGERFSKFFLDLDEAIVWENAKRVELFGEFAGNIRPAA
ncbi:hypothetical protein AVW13_11930 [Brevibacterium casei]|uniref:HNH nuclease domain-containing protein n=2 Tax=Brevibacterium casei TaxID=33889 RepID=A0AB34XT95_9MICO|nr:hypothetical protein AVW13_11930 [Brevibacterium casei]